MTEVHPPRPTRTLVKICGITRLEDGLCALQAGADWLGFIRWPRSPRYRPIGELTALLAALRREFIERPFEAVGVYVDAARATIEAEAAQAGLDRIQLHGEETPQFALDLARDFSGGLSRPVLKTIAIRDGASLARAEAYPGLDLLTDAHDLARRGGTGQRYDYSLLSDLAARRRVIVAGGLDEENVAGVVRALRPWGVDVSSAVELAPGIKDHERVRAFVHAARSI